MTKKRGLGRDLNSLLGGFGDSASTTTPLGIMEVNKKGELRKLPIELLQRGQFQPRKGMDPETLGELAESIKAQGIIQPIIVRPIGEKSFEIIAGERRWRAAQLAGLDEVPALVRDLPDESAIAMSLIENIQREDLNVIEEADALHRLMTEFEMTHQEVAGAVGKSRSAVTNILRLLNLNSDVKILVEHGDLEMGHARALLALPEMEQPSAAKIVASKELSVRETEKLVRKLLAGETIKSKKTIDPDVRVLQNDLAEKLGAKVVVTHGSKGKGKLVIQYSSLDELEGILSHIK